MDLDWKWKGVKNSRDVVVVAHWICRMYGSVTDAWHLLPDIVIGNLTVRHWCVRLTQREEQFLKFLRYSETPSMAV